MAPRPRLPGSHQEIGHGATRAQADCSWISGDQIYMARVTPTAAKVNDVTKYEFFAGHDSSGEPLWVTDFAEIKPLVDWPDRLSIGQSITVAIS